MIAPDGNYRGFILTDAEVSKIDEKSYLKNNWENLFRCFHVDEAGQMLIQKANLSYRAFIGSLDSRDIESLKRIRIKYFEGLKNQIVKNGEDCFRNREFYHCYFYNGMHYKKDLITNEEQYRIGDIIYTVFNGTEIREYPDEYLTTYFLIIDGEVFGSSRNPQDLWDKAADLCGGAVSIEYYGLLTNEEIRSREYTDLHEGYEGFIADVKSRETGELVDICVLDTAYIEEYMDNSNIAAAVHKLLSDLKEDKEKSKIPAGMK